MSEVLHKRTVLVLNKNWQAIDATTPAMAFCQMATDVATALDVHGLDAMVPTRWDQWLALPVRESDDMVMTVRGPVRAPTVLVSANYAKVPMKRPKFSLRSIRIRDKNRCQYTGFTLAVDEGNIDHVLPKSRGGKTVWTNCVLACREINSRKGDKTPEEAGLTLLRQPLTPKAVPATLMLQNSYSVPEWEPFLVT